MSIKVYHASNSRHFTKLVIGIIGGHKQTHYQLCQSSDSHAARWLVVASTAIQKSPDQHTAGVQVNLILRQALQTMVAVSPHCKDRRTSISITTIFALNLRCHISSTNTVIVLQNQAYLNLNQDTRCLAKSAHNPSISISHSSVLGRHRRESHYHSLWCLGSTNNKLHSLLLWCLGAAIQ